MTIHLKAILSSTFQWCCLLMLIKVIQTFVSVDEILQYHTIHLKAIEQYFPVVLFIMLYKMVLTFESVDGILKGDHLDETSSVSMFTKKLKKFEI